MKMGTAETLSYAAIKSVRGEAVSQTTITSSAQKEKSKEVKKENVGEMAKVKTN